MFNDGEVRIGLVLKKKQLEKDLEEVKKELEKFDEEVSKDTEKTMSKITKVGKGLGNALKSVFGTIVKIGAKLFDLVLVTGIIGAITTALFILIKAFERADLNIKQIKANFSYLGFVASKIFENLLSPAIDKTAKAIEGTSKKVNGLATALYKVVIYIGYILGQWFGVEDVFKGTSVEDYAQHMKEAQESAKGTAKATKQIKKDLMSFDEVNKLSENVSNQGTGQEAITLPNLPSINDVLKDMPPWVKWLAENKDTVLKVVGAILGLLTFSKVISWLTPLSNFFGLFTGGKLTTALGGTLSTLGTIVGMIGSAVTLGYVAYKITKDNLEQQKQLNKMAERGVELAEEDVKQERSLGEAEDFLTYKREAGRRVLEKSRELGSKITATTKQQLKNAKATAIEDKLYIDQQLEKYRKGELNAEQQQQLIQMIKDEKDYVVDVYDELEKQKMSTKAIGDLEMEYVDILREIDPEYQKINVSSADVLGNVLGTHDALKSMKENVGGVKQGFGDIAKTKLEDKKLKVNIEGDTKGLTGNFNTFLTNLGMKLANVFKNVDLSVFKNNIALIFSRLMPNLTIGNIRKMIGLRQGGIFSNPGRGVALTPNVICGEGRKAEAVIPLDDTTMDRLGSAIARHMVINSTNINQINGRTLSREVKRLMNESDFAYNS